MVYSRWNMTEPEVDLSPLALSILQLLDERPMHPYELASTMRDRHQDEFIRLNFGSLYHTVDVLERNGWIVPAEREKEGGRPERTVYKLTKPGREVLLSVVADILARPRREYPHFAAGLMFMHHLGASDAATHLAERAVAMKATIEKLNRIMAEVREQGVTRLALIELEHKIAMLEAERRWVMNLEKEINEGKLEWEVGSDRDLHRLTRRFDRLRRRDGTRTHH
jgi:DNA-binding PadR family transcriptional regulator